MKKFEKAIHLQRLTNLECTIKKGLATFIEVGEALLEIKINRGYRLRGFRNFSDYCQATFGFGDHYGRVLIRSSTAAIEVKTLTGQQIRNAGVARELTPLIGRPKAIERVARRLEKQGETFETATALQVHEFVRRGPPARLTDRQSDVADYLRVIEAFVNSTEYGQVDYKLRANAILALRALERLTAV